MRDYETTTAVERRSVLRAAGTLALAGAFAGCTGETSDDTGDGGDGSDSGDSDATDSDGGDDSFDSDAVDEYLSSVTNYDGIVDETGVSSVTVAVGVEQGGGPYGYGPAAVRVDSATTVEWEWNGRGGRHNIVHVDGEFESDLFREAGVHYEHTFEESGVYNYLCGPHQSLNMKGSVVVTE
jgi:halocyanin-like protein